MSIKKITITKEAMRTCGAYTESKGCLLSTQLRLENPGAELIACGSSRITIDDNSYRLLDNAKIMCWYAARGFWRIPFTVRYE